MAAVAQSWDRYGNYSVCWSVSRLVLVVGIFRPVGCGGRNAGCWCGSMVIKVLYGRIGWVRTEEAYQPVVAVCWCFTASPQIIISW